MKKIVYKKDEIIISEGDVCNYFYFIEEGLVSNFEINNQQEITKSFIPAPYCMTSRISFLNKIPSKENTQALERITLRRITFEQNNALMKIDSWNMFVVKMLNKL